MKKGSHVKYAEKYTARAAPRVLLMMGTIYNVWTVYSLKPHALHQHQKRSNFLVKYAITNLQRKLLFEDMVWLTTSRSMEWST